MLRIEIIGPPIVRPIGKIPKKAKALLIYLAVSRERISRERLADLLWPYQGSEQARHSLRNCLLELRKALGPSLTERCLLADFANVSLENLVLDTVEFDQFCVMGDASRATKLVRGELLADLSITSEPWEEWASEQRDAWTITAREAFLRFAADFSAAGDHAEAILAARRAIHFDKMHEPSVQLYMSVAAAAGHNGDALRCYDSLAKMLRRELGVSPDPDSRKLAAEIRKSVPLPHPTPTVWSVPKKAPVQQKPLPRPLAILREDPHALECRKHAVEDRWREIVTAIDAGLKPPIAPSLARETLAVLERDRVGLSRAAA